MKKRKRCKNCKALINTKSRQKIYCSKKCRIQYNQVEGSKKTMEKYHNDPEYRARHDAYTTAYNQRDYVKAKRVAWIREYRKTHPEYYLKSIQQMNKKHKKKYRTDPEYRKRCLDCSNKWSKIYRERAKKIKKYCSCGKVLKNTRRQYCIPCRRQRDVKSHRKAARNYERRLRGRQL